MLNFWIDIKTNVIQIQGRFMSDPTLSDIDFKNKMAWALTSLKAPNWVKMNINPFS